jgi:lysophospholipase L1-like esterase
MNILISLIWAMLLAISSAFAPLPRFVAFGDSITYRAPWATVAASASVDFVRNAGVPGNTTAQMLARLNHDVLAYNPDVVTLMGGTNDRAQGVPLRTAMAHLRTIITRLENAGARVVLMTIPPNTGSVAAWNAAIRSLADSEGVPCADIYSVLANAHGGWLPGLTTDGVHPTAAGYARMAPVIAAALVLAD